MRVSRNQIIKGVTDYIKNDLIPTMQNDRAVQIIFSIAINAAMANSKLTDSIFDNEIVRAMLDDDGSGTYEISGIVDSMQAAIQQYGGFPVQIPAIPLVSPREITVKLTADDVSAMRRKIEETM
jgi:hypothetical protein